MIQCFANPSKENYIETREAPKLLYACSVSEGEPIRVLHSHKNILEIMLIVGGEGVFTVSNQRHKVSAGNIIIVNPSVIHEETSNPENPMIQYCIGIGNLNVKKLPRNHLIADGISPVYFSKENFKLYSALFEEAYNQLYYGKPMANTVCSAVVNTVVSLLLQEIGEGQLERQSSDFIIKRARNYIEENYSYEITLDILAAELNMSKYYLSRLFKEKSGYSFNEYINRLRIGEAQNLLITTDHSIAKIGQLVGIDNPSYFNLIFNRIVGTQPTKYRSNYRKSEKSN